MIDSPHLIAPGHRCKLAELPTDDTGKFKNKSATLKKTEELVEQLSDLQNVLYAESKRSLLRCSSGDRCGRERRHDPARIQRR